MRAILLCAAAIVTATPALAQQAWIAACQGGKDAQYTQTIDGTGYFNVANGNGTYTTIPVKQAFYDGDVVCGLTGADQPPQIGEVCADRKRNAIAMMTKAEMRDGDNPEIAPIYCSARVSVH